MTIEEAKQIVKSECYIADLLDLDRTQMVNTALDTVIEAAERESVLDKIREEIERKAHSGQWSEATMYGLLKAVAIIDKYKAESDKESDNNDT